MNILTIEPTPSPNTMKVVIDQELAFGTAHNYNKQNADGAPAEIQRILQIDGVKGVYHVADFLAVERIAKFDWEGILAQVRVALGEDAQAVAEAANRPTETYGEVYVHVQMFKGIPLQVKVFDAASEHRIALPKQFIESFNAAVAKEEDDNYIFLRKWVDYGVRYGEKEDVAAQIAEEVVATYPQERLTALVEEATTEKEPVAHTRQKVTVAQFTTDNWQERFQLLDQMVEADVDDVPVLALALNDEQMAIRRLAVVYLGMIEDEVVVPYLVQGLQDKSAAVRRTAGDCMSDLGFTAFEPAMIQALTDKNKLVRWRAAMYLFETGTEAALDALRAAEDDAEFEVKLQVKMAIARIEQGEEAQGSVWKQMTEARSK